MADDKKTIIKTELEGVYIIQRPVFQDERGFFHEVFRKNELQEKTGYEFNMVQPNHSRSQKGVLRGIHTAPYAKIVYAIGRIQQVVVDLRKDSPTFKKHLAIEFGGNNFVAVFIPPFCGNAFQALEDNADYFYYVDDYWGPDKEFQVAYNDPELSVPWAINPPAFLSERDSNQPTVRDLLEKGIIK